MVAHRSQAGGVRHYAVVLLAMLVSIGCRTPRRPVFQSSDRTIQYDTSWRTAETPGPLVRDMVDRYGETLAEPVSVVAATESGATWSVLFGTNRAPFDQRVAEHSVYGECRVDVPRRPRGTLAIKGQTNPLDGVIPASWRGPKPPEVEVSPPRALTDDDFHETLRERVARSSQRDVLLFVHGFNVGFDAAMARAAQLGNDVPFNGAVVAYSWPSLEKIEGYQDDERAVDASIPAFRQFVLDLRRELPPDVRVHVLVHSMGNRLVLRALEGIEPTDGRKPFANVVLAAPDVGIAEFAQRSGDVTRLAERVTLYVCGMDNALTASKELHGEQRIGDALPPVIVPGVETIDATPIDTSLLGHSYYGDNAGVLADLFSLLKEDRGANGREWLQREQRADGAGHWVFTKYPDEVVWTWHFDGPASE